jgi:hypothetical protein
MLAATTEHSGAIGTMTSATVIWNNYDVTKVSRLGSVQSV